MISLPSFFKSKLPPPEQPKVEPSFRSRQSKVDLEKEDVLTENPEVQRARHRLIGAGFLLLIAVIGLPRLFDAQPKKINNDVVVKVVQSVTNNPSTGNVSTVEEKVISSTGSDLTASVSPTKSSPPDTSLPPVVSQEKAKGPTDSSSSASLANKKEKGSLQTDPGEVIVNPQSINASKPLSKDATKETSANKADAKGSKYIVQIAALSSTERVKNLTVKIKDLNITTYVIEKKRDAPESPVIFLVRAGPFNSKEEAVNAEKKISALGMGLSPTIVEINK
ncbi:SPOR domain-containing protein [Polynucleobacter kasalickyi]|uniref:DedD protein n=1 Tax=Polynucleobacter kasalickyi TaxID=1938817 RepID=A0A1W1ZDL5_9BURK|nr:SPOR domain-containing protein [Polynucleobacter kasalickyi]SMC46484.1 DedD protein [Polynucleobacter kasalickyi]